MKLIKGFIGLLLLLLVLSGAVAYYFYTTPALRSGPRTVYVKAGWNYDSLIGKFDAIGLRFPRIFDPVAQRMNLPSHIYPGKYKLTGAETTVELIKKFRGAMQEKVTIRLEGEMSEQQVLHEIFSKLEFDSAALYDAYLSSEIIGDMGFDSTNRLCFFIPDSYFFMWSVTPDKVLKRFAREYQLFWDHEKKVKAVDVKLAPVQVGILASIVDGEVIFTEEMPRVAGVYLNRLNKKWPLQADPTIKYMINQEGRKRILYADLEKDHPYNTYKRTGLPPGPIALPSKDAMLAVLNPEEHNYMFFVARDDFSGYHEFSVTHNEHVLKASRYRRALDRAGIMN